MDLSRAPLIVVIVIIEIILDLILTLLAAVADISYSSELLTPAALVIIAVEAWLNLKYLM